MNAPSDTKIVNATLRAGRLLKHFRIESQIGEGGMGMVYRAHDTQLHRLVAIKLLSPQLTHDPDRKERFLQEARAAARISHPAIAQIYSVAEEDEHAFIVMELVDGKTVRELIANRELDLLGALEVAIHVADGLAKAHQMGIVHRDIKPANVMLNRDGHVKILDFGLAKLLDQGLGLGGAQAMPVATTQEGVILGTPAYMSPEQVRGEAVSSQADLFALGILLFEMITGKSPFERENIMDSLHAVAFDEIQPMKALCPQIPDELERVVTQCLRKRPEERPVSALKLARDLRQLRRDMESGVARQTSWRERLGEMLETMKQQPRSRYAWVLGGMGVLVVALGLVLSKFGFGWGVILLFLGFTLYRHVRNRLHYVQARFTRRVSRFPEVRLIAIQGAEITVVVDRPVAQLYGRINDQLRTCNRQLYFGQPMTVSIQHEATPEEIQRRLSGCGVCYVREDTVKQAH